MGITYVEIELANLSKPNDTRPVEMMVDSGAVFSMVPAGLLAELGIEPLSEEVFFLADGKRVTRKRGGAVFKYGGKVGVADVLFGEEGDSNLLGAFSLEAMGYGLDPLKRELIALPMILGGYPPA